MEHLTQFFNKDTFFTALCGTIGFETPYFVHYAMKRGWTRRAILAILLCALVGLLWSPLLTELGVTSYQILSEGLYIGIGAVIAVIVAVWHLNKREGRDL